MSQTVWREGNRIRCTDGRGYGDSVTDDEVRKHIARPFHASDQLSVPFAEAVLAIRAFERASAVSSAEPGGTT